MNTISPEDARWLALLIDTEGNILVRKSHCKRSIVYCASISIANTWKPLIDITQDMIGLGFVHQKWDKKSRVPVHYLCLSSKQALSVLRAIYPYLIVKKRQAKVAIYAQSLNRNHGGARGEFGKGTRRLTIVEQNLRCKLWMTSKELNNHQNPDISWIPEPDEIDKDQPQRLSGDYGLYEKYQRELGANNLMSGGEIFRMFKISHRQAYRWVDKWRRENSYDTLAS